MSLSPEAQVRKRKEIAPPDLSLFPALTPQAPLLPLCASPQRGLSLHYGMNFLNFRGRGQVSVTRRCLSHGGELRVEADKCVVS